MNLLKVFRRLAGCLSAFVLVLCAATPASATHLRYGSIKWQVVATDSTSYTVQFTLTLATRWTYPNSPGSCTPDATACPAQGATISLQSVLQAGGPFNFGDGTTVYPTGTVTFVDTADDWMISNYTFTHKYSKTTTSAVASLTAANRISTLQVGAGANLNLQTTVSNYTGTDLNGVTVMGASPTSGQLPIVYNYLSQVNTFQVTAYTPLNATLKYRAPTLAEMYGAGTTSVACVGGGTTTSTLPPGLSISSTGVVTWDTTKLKASSTGCKLAAPAAGDEWPLQVIVEEYDNTTQKLITQVPVDVMLELATPVVPPTITVSPSGSLVVSPGTPVTLHLTGTSQLAGDKLTFIAAGLPTGAVISGFNAAVSSPATATVTWTPTAAQAGTYVINFAVNSSTQGQGQVASTIVVTSVIPQVVCPVSPSTSYQQPLTVTGTVTGPSGDPARVNWLVDGNSVQLNSGLSLSPTATSVSYTSNFGEAGTHQLQMQLMDGNGGAASCTSTVTVRPIAQTISMGAVADVTFGIPPFLVTPTSTSGLPVTLAGSGACSVSGNQVTLNSAGACTLLASQAGNIDYYPAPPVSTTFNVLKAAKTITFPAPTLPITVNDTVTLTATTSSGDPVVFTATNATVNGNVLTLTNAGAVFLYANSPASTNYSAAAQVSYTFAVNPAASTYTAPTEPVGTVSPAQYATVNLPNGGTPAAINVNAQGTANAEFQLTDGGTCQLGTAYTAGQTCTVAYTFTPAYPGQRVGSISLADASNNVLGTSMLSGVAIGPQAVFYPGAQTVVDGTTAGDPFEVATDVAGNVYLGSFGTGKVFKYTKNADGTYTQSSLGSGFTSVAGVAVDGAGNVYAADPAQSSVTKLTYNPFTKSYAQSILFNSGNSAMGKPWGLNVGTDGVILIGTADGRIMRETPKASGGYTETVIAFGANNIITSVAKDTAGDLFVAAAGNNMLLKLTPANGTYTPSAIATNVTNLNGVVLDAAGTLYASSTSKSQVMRWAPNADGTYTQLPSQGTGFTRLNGVAIDPAGNVLVANDDGNYNSLTILNASSTQPLLSFPITPIGTTSGPVTSQLLNIGNQPLSFSSISVASGVFDTTASTCSTVTSLAPAALCNITATYTPTTVGKDTQPLTISDNSLNGNPAQQTMQLAALALAGAKTITFPALASPVQALTTAQLAATASNGDPVTYSVLSGDATISGTTLTFTTAGTVVIAADSAATATYKAAAEVKQTITVNQLAQTITFSVPSSVTYGAAPITINATGGSSGNPVTFSVTGPATIAGNVLTITGAGSVSVTANQAGNVNYLDATAVSQTINVNKAAATVTPDSATKVYGSADPALTGTLSGFLAADNVTATYARAAGESVAGGPYAITATLSSPALANYSVTYAPAALTITPAALNVTASNGTMTYGGTVPTITAAFNGLVAQDTPSSFGTVVCSTTATSHSNVGSYPATCSGVVNSNYVISYTGGNVTVSPAPLSVTAADAARTYGSANPSFTGTITGIVNSDAITATYTSAATTASGVGTFAIIPSLSGAALSNYTVTSNNGTLTITPAPLSVTAANAARTYGSANPNFTGTITGIVNSDAITATYASAATTASGVGTFAIIPSLSGAALSNYTVTSNNGTLTITPAPLSVTAANAARTYGSANPSLTGTITGIVNNDTITATYASAATTASGVGTYAIVPTLSGAALANYTLVSNNGTLTITAAPLSVTANNATSTYGSAAPAFTGTLSGIVNNDAITSTYASATTAASGVGTYAIVPTLSGAALANYTVITNNGVLTITAAPLSVTAANAARAYGSANPSFTGTVTGIVNNDAITATYASAAAAASGVGTYAIVPTLSGASLANYTVVTNNGTLTITAAPLSVTAANAARMYGSANPGFTGTITGIVNNDAITATYASAATTASGVGTYAIVPTLSGAALANYAIVSNNGVLTITAAPLSVTAANAARTYGAANPNFTGTITGIMNSDAITATYASPATAGSSVGTYAIVPTLSGAALANYAVAANNGTLTVSAAPLSVTAANASRAYGSANPSFTGTITGVQNGDAITATYASAAMAGSNVGNYDIVPTLSGAALANYTVVSSNGVLSITAAPLSVTANSATGTYGSAAPSFTGTINGIVNGDAITATYASAATSGSGVGTYAIVPTLSGASLANYTVVSNNGVYTVAAAPLSVTANNATATYGSAIPAFTGAVTGIVNGDAITATYASQASTGTGVGTYAIVPTLSGASLANYTVVSNNGTLTITTAPLVVTASSGLVVYGGSVAAVTPSFAGFVNNDAAASLGAIACSTTATSTSAAGTYPNTCAGAANPNYSISYVAGVTTIQAAALTITASNGTMIYGGTVPAITPSFTGFVNGDAATSLGAVSCSTTASSSSTVGSYPSTCSGAANPNYTVNYVAGSVSVTQATPSITWATPAAITYGAALSGSQLNATSSVAGILTYSPAAGTALKAGQQTLSVTFTPTDAADYNSVTQTVVLTVNKANPSIAWANPTAITYGAALSAAQLNATSSVAGSLVYAPAAGQVLNAGQQTLTVSFTPTDAADYNTATANVVITVNKANPTITWASPATIAYGTPLSATQLNATANVAGSFTYSPAAGAVLNGGVNTLSATFTPTDANNYNSASKSVSITVNETSVSMSPGSGTQAYQTWTNFVAGPTWSGNYALNRVPTGSITLLDNGNNLVTLTLGGDGKVYWTTNPPLEVGVHNITALYSGDKNYAPGLSAMTTITVLPAKVNLQATCFNGSLFNSSPLQCQVSVSAATTTTPSGVITYTLDGGAPVTAALNYGNAAFTIPGPLAAGNHTVSVSYDAQGNYAAAGPVVRTVYTAPAPTIVHCNPSSWYLQNGSSFTLTGSVTTSNSGVPVGVVIVYDNGVAIGQATIGANGVVSYSIPRIGKGSHTYSLKYAGNGNYAAGSVDCSGINAY